MERPPISHSGRSMMAIIRNHVNIVAWYLVQAQTPPADLTAMLQFSLASNGMDIMFATELNSSKLLWRSQQT